MANNKTVVCKSCNTPILKKAKICPNCGVKNKKPFYKRTWFIILAIIFVFIALGTIGGNDTEKFEWSDFELSYLLPKPASNRGEIISDSDDTLDVYISKISKDEYNSYLDECREKGFNIESEKSENSYYAFNADGYKLSLWYDDTDEEMNVELYAPEELGTLEWPENGLGSVLPTPSSTIGKVERDDSDYFSVKIGDMSLDDFSDYIKECEETGFNIDYSKSEGYYSAKNKDNQKVYVKYSGFNTVEITTEIVGNEKTTEDSEEDVKDENNQTDDSQYIDGMRPEFKEAMDSYEEFMDEYVVFMKKYANSDGTDMSIYSDYANYMSKYAKFVEDFEKWEDEQMNTAETAYYIQVQNRVSQKLLEIA